MKLSFLLNRRLRRAKKVVKSTKNEAISFAHEQFSELIKRNLSIPVTFAQ